MGCGLWGVMRGGWEMGWWAEERFADGWWVQLGGRSQRGGIPPAIPDVFLSRHLTPCNASIESFVFAPMTR